MTSRRQRERIELDVKSPSARGASKDVAGLGSQVEGLGAKARGLSVPLLGAIGLTGLFATVLSNSDTVARNSNAEFDNLARIIDEVGNASLANILSDIGTLAALLPGATEGIDDNSEAVGRWIAYAAEITALSFSINEVSRALGGIPGVTPVNISLVGRGVVLAGISAVRLAAAALVVAPWPVVVTLVGLAAVIGGLTLIQDRINAFTSDPGGLADIIADPNSNSIPLGGQTTLSNNPNANLAGGSISDRTNRIFDANIIAPSTGGGGGRSSFGTSLPPAGDGTIIGPIKVTVNVGEEEIANAVSNTATGANNGKVFDRYAESDPFDPVY